MPLKSTAKNHFEALDELRLKDSALNAAANAIAIADVGGTIVWVNNAFSQLTGYSASEAIGRNPRDLVKSGQHDDMFYRSLWETVLAKQVWHGEIINRRKDGSHYHEEMTITPVLNAQGDITHFVAVKQDITERVLSQKRLAYSETLFRSLFESTSSGVAVYRATQDGLDFIIKDINGAVERLENIRRGDVLGERLLDVFPSAKDFGLVDVLQRVSTTGEPEHLPITFYQDNRIAGWRQNYVYRLPTGEVVAVYDDVTAVKQAEAAIKESNQLMGSLLESMAEGAYGVDSNGVCTFVNRSFLRILGYSDASEVVGQHIHELIHHSHSDGSPYPSTECLMYAAYRQSRDIHCSDEVFWRKDGAAVQVEYWSSPIITDGVVMGAVATFIDIADRLAAQAEINQLAFYDPLTTLPNRRLLNDRLDRSMVATQRSGLHGALMILDLDNFKSLNDTRGHLVGDFLLVEAARRLSHCIRDVDTVSRFGGDEFVVLLKDLSADADTAGKQAAVIAEKIRSSLSSPYLLTIGHDGPTPTVVEHRSTASIGAIIYSGTQVNPSNLLKWADAAMYRAKDSGRNAIRFHESVED